MEISIISYIDSSRISRVERVFQASFPPVNSPKGTSQQKHGIYRKFFGDSTNWTNLRGSQTIFGYAISVISFQRPKRNPSEFLNFAWKKSKGLRISAKSVS